MTEAIRLVAEIVDALGHAHSQGVVHRDVKLDNVMLSARHALVMDFGVAKAAGEASGGSQVTTAGVALGTPAYMAPEQEAADPHLDHRVDIYAVGVLAYELLAGRPPFVGGTPQQVLAAHITEEPEPLSRYRPGITPSLEQVVMRCLAKRPADRWQSAEELLAHLEPLVTASGDVTPAKTPRNQLRRVGFATGGIALALVVGAVATFTRSGNPEVLDENLLAVAPFDTVSSGVVEYREGLVTILSRSLDGAGPLRTVSPTVVVRRWAGQSDPTSASSLGHRTGAGLVVFGQVVPAGADSVRLTATMNDVRRERPVGEVECGTTVTA